MLLRALLGMVAAAMILIAVPAGATLPPEVYEQQRASAPVILEGVVQQDPGGRLLLAVQRVIRGVSRPGQRLFVRYPALLGPTPPPGAAVYYRPFPVGTRLRVFAHPSPTDLVVVHGGIDVLQVPPPPRGGCASCSVGADSHRARGWPWLALLAVLAWRRSRGHAIPGAILAGLGLSACGPTTPPTPTPPVASTPPPPPPAPVMTETEGDTKVTVLSRPDHPAVRPDGPAPAAEVTDASCRAAPACEKEGRCTAAGTRCVAATDDDCLAVPVCAAGRCQREGERCVETPCDEGWACKQRGACKLDAGRCVAGSDAGCAASAACREQGRCHLEAGACVATDDDCTASRVCVEGGRCVADNGRCIAADATACRQASACRTAGRCQLRDGHCVKSCAEASLCADLGRCTEQTRAGAKTCVATSDAACEASSACLSHGRCSLGLKGACVARDDVDCRKSRACLQEGRCTHARGRCVPGSDAECAQALVACKVQGRCRHQGARCVP